MITLIPRLIIGWPVRRILALAYLRSVTWLSFDQSRSILIPTGQNIGIYCNKTGLLCKSVDISSDGDVPLTKLHFIHLADRPNAKVLLYFHGGAYVNPIDIKGQVPFVIECARTINASGVFFLEYSLAPEWKYPNQLVQAVEALEHILRTYSPSQLVLGGDSAGGHLILSLLAHIQRPNPNVKPLVGFNAPGRHIHSALIISPWVTLKYASNSFKTNATRDYIRAKKMSTYTAMWAPEPDEVWADLLVGGAQLWHGLPVDNLLITAGGWECFHDDIIDMASQLDAKPFGSGAAVELSIAEKEVHVQCALDKAMGVPHGKSALDILHWLSTRHV